jgi:hypothetical protein
VQVAPARPSAAPAAEPAPAAADSDSEASEIEAALSEIWGDVLGLTEVGRADNFFDLGGTSLLLRRAHGAMQTRFGKQVPIVAMFEHPTIAALTAYLLQGGSSSAAFSSAKARAERQAEALRRLRETTSG